MLEIANTHEWLDWKRTAWTTIASTFTTSRIQSSPMSCKKTWFSPYRDTSKRFQHQFTHKCSTKILWPWFLTIQIQKSWQLQTVPITWDKNGREYNIKSLSCTCCYPSYLSTKQLKLDYIYNANVFHYQMTQPTFLRSFHDSCAAQQCMFHKGTKNSVSLKVTFTPTLTKYTTRKGWASMKKVQ